MAFCAPCKRTFVSRRALAQHLNSPKHRCKHCQRFFKSAHSKTQHAQNLCYQLTETPPEDSKLRGKLMLGPKIQTEVHYITPTYTGIPRSMIAPVFKVARRLRFMKPDVEMLLKHVDTQLDRMVVSSPIEAALRLVPPNNTLEGRLEAKTKMEEKAERALFHEMTVTDKVRDLGYEFLTEEQQKQMQPRLTPDIRFIKPVRLHGQCCCWIEYKSYFGFTKNPYITSKNKEQFHKYATHIGPGAVVYKLGYEIDHISVPDISFYREVEFLNSLGRHSKYRNEGSRS